VTDATTGHVVGENSRRVVARQARPPWKRRTISLLNQGLMHYGALPKMKLDMFEPLMAKFGELLREHRVFREVFGLI
jgi:hypothetical protein